MKGINVSLYYNQISDLIIHSDENVSNFAVLNANGQQIFYKVFNEPVNSISCPLDLNKPGLYFVRMEMQNGTMLTKRFVKF